MAVITIRGQLGSGAPQIGRLCAETLHLDYYDREIINRIAERLERPRQEVIAKEMLPLSWVKRIARFIEHDFLRSGYSTYTGPGQENPFLDDRRYIKGLKSVIRRLARTEAAVISGRGSQFFLKDYPGVLHVLVVAPLDLRIKRVMESYGLDAESANEKITRYDTNRREFIKKYFKADLENPVHYDMTVNTANISHESAAALVIQALALKNRVPSAN